MSAASFTPSGLPSVGDVPWGTHFCQFYGGRDDLVQTLVPYFVAGLRANERCLWITSAPLERVEARDALRAQLPELARYEAAGQIEIVDHAAWYARSADALLSSWLDAEERALAHGFRGLRLTGNTTFVEREGWRDFAEYEERVTDLFRGRRIVGLCSYCMERCDATAVIDVVRNHQFALVRRSGEWDLLESAEVKAAKRELQRANDELERRVADRTAALETTSAILRTLVDRAPVGFALFDRDFRFTVVNERLAELNGLTVEAHLGRSPLELLPGLSAQQLQRWWSQVMETGVPLRDLALSGETPAAPGVLRHWVEHWYPVEVNGERIGVGAIVEEVTERRRAEEQLRESEQRFRRVIEEIPHLVWTARPDGVMDYCSEQFLSFIGLTLEEARRRWIETVHPDDVERVVGGWIRAVEKGEPYEVEVRQHHIDGGDYRWFLTRSNPQRDATGRVTRWLGTLTDIDETKRLRDLLAEAEERFRTVFETMPILGWTVRPDGYADHFNREWYAYTGTTPAEAEGSGWHRALDPDELPAVVERWRASMATGTPIEMELRLRRHDGALRRFLTRVHPIRDAGGAIVRWVGVNIDVEDQHHALAQEKEMRENAEQAARFAELFAGFLAHDLRNPLSAIVTGGNYLARLASDEKQARTSERIISSGMRMSRMIDQLLDLTRIRLGGGLPLERREAMLAEICRDVVDELAISHPARAPQLLIDGDTSGSWDVDRIAQVVSNLVGNALQHGSADRPVLLRLDGRDPSTMEILVESGGVIDPEVLPVLFEPFRGDRRGDREKTRGLGIGLYISEQIVLAHRGRIAVRSTPAEGTVFAISLPRRRFPVG